MLDNTSFQIQPQVRYDAFTRRSVNRVWLLNRPVARVANMLLAITLGSILGGCSCSRRPEWESGLERRDRPTRQTGGTELGNSAIPGDAGDGSGNGAGGAGDGAGGGSGTNGGASGTGEQGQGDGGSGPAGGSGAGTADGSASGRQPVAGPGSGSAAGAGDAPDQPPAALPGRPLPKPRYDAAKATEVAENHLDRAVVSQRRGDLNNAYAEALEAFEAVEPHAATDESCKAVLSRAKRMLAELAESQNLKTRPRNVPTLFE